jgi:hypothetical protein
VDVKKVKNVRVLKKLAIAVVGKTVIVKKALVSVKVMMKNIHVNVDVVVKVNNFAFFILFNLL